ncbi:carbamoyl-phosphate synthase large subunit [Chitinophaga polysaccharea]|uniref:carbamoyl-phosphate synthase large subunit n=1 Tax=Chitinophaga polysaccharea TaxID=1293035 RepID=UPI001158D82E|nr:carbamoyl-phosphate synthase large subunit [Chitinophaga polysaccharea]
MPKRKDIKSILLIGPGPIVIGQACEFDYSGTQACKALREDGYKIILVNSNPATIMTDPDTADKTYIEPLTVEILEKIIQKEKPDSVLPTFGGQTALNLAMDLHNKGILKKYNIEMLGAKPTSIAKAEDRKLFKQAMLNIGLDLPKSDVANTLEDAKQAAMRLGYPCVVRPSFTLGGTGGGIAYSENDLETIVAEGLKSSIITEVLIEESIIGWKEYELEVMRDKNDNVIVICSIENLDAMGVHTGDSITVAPAQTLTDKEYQKMRDASIAIMREIGVETGGSNVQFAVNPKDGRMIVIEMNPRVSRSSALASKATGFPIAKFAAKLAVGYTLDEIQNDITKKTVACFEPTIDYCVVKIPRFNFDKFPKAESILGTSMKSVGETMAIGRTFKEAFQKGLRGLETKRYGLGFDNKDMTEVTEELLVEKLSKPNSERIYFIKYALEKGMSIDQLYAYTHIDPWFLNQMNQIFKTATSIIADEQSIRRAKQYGFSDIQLKNLLGFGSEIEMRTIRKKLGVLPTYKLVDTCAAEFEAFTPYFYSTYEEDDESRVTLNPKVMILGGGPNRIGQGIEFDYCCVHASMAIREEGYESIMVNCNPETVSTDFDVSDKLYFEPLTLEDVLNIYENEKPMGVIIQFGGQTPLNLAIQLEKSGVKILGTSPANIDLAEDRKKFQQLLHKINLIQPANDTVTSLEEASDAAKKIGYPVVVRPSYVLGGSSMEIVYNQEELKTYMGKALAISPEHPILIDKFLEDAIEVDVDALADGKECVISGIMEHIEEAGIHSGDSACSLPTYSLSKQILSEIREATIAIAKEIHVIGLLNIQFAITKDNQLYVLEVNPRGSRTVPFVSKATGVQWAKMATKVILGKSIEELKLREVVPPYYSVKEAVFPFKRFPGSDILLTPEMKSTGESMGIADTFGMAFLKSQIGGGYNVPTSGNVFISVEEKYIPSIVPLAMQLTELGFDILFSPKTQKHVNKIVDGRSCLTNNSIVISSDEEGVSVIDYIRDKKINMIINICVGKGSIQDEMNVRQQALIHNIPVITTLPAAMATVNALSESFGKNSYMNVRPLQELYLTE